MKDIYNAKYDRIKQVILKYIFEIQFCLQLFSYVESIYFMFLSIDIGKIFFDPVSKRKGAIHFND